MSEFAKPLLPAIPEPVPTPESLYETVLVLKQAVELLLGHRAPKTTKGDSGHTSGMTQSEKTIISLVDIRDAFTASINVQTELRGEIQTVEGGVEANASAITTLEVTVTDLENDVTGIASAVTTLETRVTAAEGDITSVASSVTTLESTVTDLEADVTGNATAITSLSTQVTALDGEVTALSDSFTTVFASNGVGDASAMFRMVAVAAPSGYDASIQLEAKVEADAFDSSRAVMLMDVGTGIGSRIRFIADRLVMASGAGAGDTIVDFASFSGSKIVFSTDVEINGNLIVNGSITKDEIEAGAISEGSSAFTASLQFLTGSYVVVQTLIATIDTDEKLVLFANATWDALAPSVEAPGGIEYRILRGAVDLTGNLTAGLETTGIPQQGGLFSWTLIDETVSTNTYTLEARRTGSDGSVITANRTLTALKIKR